MPRHALPRLTARAAWEIAICAVLLGGCGRVTRDAHPSEDPSSVPGGPEDAPEDSPKPAPKKGALGGVCEPLSELDPEFPGFLVDEVAIDEYTPACVSGTCVIQGFQGRVSCPYGQADASGGCALPGSDDPVLTPVYPQLEARPPEVGALCSCHCAGPGPGPFCRCPSHLECTHLVDDLGVGSRDIVGSYCLPKGGRYERGTVDLSSSCRSDLQNCDP